MAHVHADLGRVRRTDGPASPRGTLTALSLANPHLKEQLGPLIKETDAENSRYERETTQIKAKATGIDKEKRRHGKKGDRFQYAFVMLQAGVVLCTIASSSKKKGLWLVAVVLGLFGLVVLFGLIAGRSAVSRP